MTLDLKPYPVYKGSGVPWLGQVPAHWEVKPLKRWLRINARVLPETTPVDFRFRYIDIGSVGTGRLTETPQSLQFGTAPSRARRVLRQGDTIVSTVRTYLKAVWFVADDMDSLIASTGFAVLTPVAGIEPKYVSYLVQSNAFTDRVSSESVGIAYPAIAEGRVASFKVGIPPLPEQSAIARYLDHADRRIQRYIRAKQKLIKLLEEQKQAIIHRAVTRGLDPHVRLKPSGVEWLGDVPEHWEILRSKYLFREVDARSATGQETHLSMSQKYGLIPSSEIEEKRLVSESYAGGKLCKKNDLILNRLKAHLGVFALAPQPGTVSSDYTVLRAKCEMDPRYFEALYRTPACRIELRQRAKGIVQGFWRLYTDDFYNIRMPVPPPPEQRIIMKQLDTNLSNLNTTITRTQHEINLVREYRTCLIADVVTGKLDVRAAAAQLPDEPAEADIADALAGDLGGMGNEDGEMAESETVEVEA